MKSLKLVLLSVSALLISQAPAIARDLFERLPNNSRCYIVTSQETLINLDYLCQGIQVVRPINSIHSSDISSFSSTEKSRLNQNPSTIAHTCPSGTIDRAGHGTLCTAPCPQFFNFDRASLRRLGAALYDGQKPV